MKKMFLNLAILLFSAITIVGQSPVGFKYQAVIRDNAGEIIADENIGIKISLLKGSTEGDIIYSETFTPTTNEFGLINIVVGSGSTQEGNFSQIDWSSADYFIRLDLDISGGSDYTTMGTSQLLSVPYAQYAFSSGGWADNDETVYTYKNVGVGTDRPTGRLQIVATDDTTDDEPIFEVINNNGDRVFAVFNNRVEIIVDEDENDKSRGGFAVSGRTTTKDPEDIFVVRPGLTQVFVDEASDKSRGGFAVSGRTTTKSDPEDIFLIQPNLTQVFVDELTDKSRGGFAVSGRTTTKSDPEDIFHIQPGLTQVFVDETTDKSRGGFAVSGRTTTKNDGIYDVLNVRPERTDIFINPSNEKFFADGFGISLYDDMFDSEELFAVSQIGAVVNIGMAVAPRVTTADLQAIDDVSATAGGKVLTYGGTDITKRGVIYSTQPSPGLDVDQTDPGQGGIVYDHNITEGGFGEFTVELETLLPGTTYFVRAFAVNEDELVGFGDVKSFETTAYTLNFEVLDGDTEANINDAVITITSITHPHIGSITNETGDYEFDVTTGEYNYEINAEGYFENTGNVIIEQDGQIETVLMEPASEITFSVKDEEGNPLNDLEVYIYDELENSDLDYTDENGEATFNPTPGTWYYSIYDYSGNYESIEDIEFTVEQDDIYTIDVTLNKLPAYTVTFEVKQIDGEEPSVGTLVEMYRETVMHKDNSKQENGYFQGETDENGIVVFGDVPEGFYYYNIESEDGFANGETLIEDNITLEVRLSGM